MADLTGYTLKWNGLISNLINIVLTFCLNIRELKRGCFVVVMRKIIGFFWGVMFEKGFDGMM